MKPFSDLSSQPREVKYSAEKLEDGQQKFK